MQTLHIIKIGGNVVDNPNILEKFIEDFSAIASPKILVHGGGKLANELAEKLGIPQTMVEGRRITDAETLKITTMVYAGLINKQLVAQLQAKSIQALGLSGADNNLILSEKRNHSSIDFGFVGDIKSINTSFLSSLLSQNIVPVVCSITHNGNGMLLNTNADTIATELAIALSGLYKVHLSFCFEKKGVLADISNEDSYIPQIEKSVYNHLKSEQKISDGMLPKLENAFQAIEKGVSKVLIYHAKYLHTLENDFIGTELYG